MNRRPNRLTAYPIKSKRSIRLIFLGENEAYAAFNFQTPEPAPKSRPVVRKPIPIERPRPVFLAQTQQVRIVTILTYRPPVAQLPGHAIETPMDVLRRAHRNSRRAHGFWW